MLPVVLRRLAPPLAAALLLAGLPALTTSPVQASAAPVTTVPVPTVAEADPIGGVVALARALPGFRLDAASDPWVEPRRYAASRIDVAEASTELAPAPTRAEADAGAKPLRISLPAPDGITVLFDVVEHSVMEPALQARHPELRTYAGVGVTDPRDTIRLALTPAGLSASVRSVVGNRTWYVDPAYLREGVTAHVSYLRSALPAAPEFDEIDIATPRRASLAERGAAELQRRAGEAVVQRTYRMAWVTTPSYAADFASAPGGVLAEKVRVINRANQIYMDDMAIDFVLVDGSEQLNLDTPTKATGANGPCGANPCFEAADIESCGGNGIDRNNFVAGQIIGADRYDIGHLGSGAGGGGVAYLGVVGGELKAGGCTALDEPRGDFYAIDYFAHEVGHQMGGNHTFDGLNGSCAPPNRQSTTSVEPGSGSTVMAYAGICGADDLQPHTDPYFSQRTIDEFTAVVTAAPENLNEQQVVNLRGFGGTDSFQLTYPGKAPVTITNGTNYNAAGLQAAIMTLTGKAATVSPYDGGDALTTDGFTVDFADTADYDRLGVANGTGGTAGFTGVTIEGGATTNQGTAETIANRRPVADAGQDKTIPVLTPFELTATATDADAGQAAGLTYLWEQNDEGLRGEPIFGFGPGQPLTSPRPLGPLFRVFGEYADVSAKDTLLYESPGQNLTVPADRSRSFPDLAQVLRDETNAEDPLGTCPPALGDPMTALEPGAALDCYSELLPNRAYALLSSELNFRVTVRDGFAAGGGTGSDDVTLALDPTAGPFLVTSREAAGTPAQAGGTETVEWDVAGTDAATMAPNVKISISLDSGKTFPFVVAASTPNDGSEAVTLPKFNSTQARIRIEAVDNYFYDTNDADFAITGGVDLVPPQTTITGGLERRGFLAAYRTRYRFASTIAGSQFACTLDGNSVPCGDGSAQLRGLKPGTHVFTVAATSPDGLVDPTPARREFAVLANERNPATRSDGWRNVKDKRFYRATYFTTREKGRTLGYRLERASRFQVLFAKGPGLGRVAVLLNGKRIRTINLAAQRPQLGFAFTSTSFTTPRSGTVTLRTLDRKPVIVDGFGTFVIPRS
ncbi:MAG: hypothetical protein JWN84_3237 [Nocardioides sp.]|nr:hypothetical protein [Nocardioides sp.]